jgi:cell division protein FtsZ
MPGGDGLHNRGMIFKASVRQREGKMLSLLKIDQAAKIKVIGVGGAGGNAINNMITSELEGVKYISANTDAQSLDISKAATKIQLGSNLTEGLGAGGNPDVGSKAALESTSDIRAALEESHMVFIAAGFGGGTGTGATPIIADICRKMGILTVAVITRPFSFEGKKRMKQADQGLSILEKVTDTVITIPNDRLRILAPKNAKMVDMFRTADEILLHSVKGITDLIIKPGLVNLDFADIKTIMAKAGLAIMGIGASTGDNRAIESTTKAISHPLLEDVDIRDAKGVLMNISSNSHLTMEEMTEASDRIFSKVSDDTEIIWGAAVDDSLGREMRVTVIATGIRPGFPKKKNPKTGDPKPSGKARAVSPSNYGRTTANIDNPAADRYRSSLYTPFSKKYNGTSRTDSKDLSVPTFLRIKTEC